MIHHEFKRGTPILIILKNGEYIIDKFMDNFAKGIICKKTKVKYEDCRSITIYRGKI